MSHVITFAPLIFDGECVRVRWQVEPATPLYRRTEFTLDFSGVLEPRTLPESLWWTVVLLIVHSHWNLLRPCRVVLPLRLPPGEIEFWSRLLDLERASLELYRDRGDFARTIAIEVTGKPLATGALPPVVDRFATAFSGGKESLLQACLLAEISARPLLVNVQSPMPPLVDHSTARRTHVLREIARRRDCEVAVVRSDWRSAWDNFYSWAEGYRQTVNEQSDTFLYMSILLAVGAARGIRTVFLGAEFENHIIAQPWLDRCVAYYVSTSPTVLHALDRFLSPSGLRLGSLVSPLSQFEILTLLWRRYADVADLQNSCYDMRSESESYCSRCRKCLQLALYYLALEIDPARVGLDVTRAFKGGNSWGPHATPASGNSGFAAQRIRPARVRRFFRSENWKQRLGLEDPPAFRELVEFIRPYANTQAEWVDRYRPEFVARLLPAVRERLGRIYQEYFPVLDKVDRREECARVDAGAAWIAAPLFGNPLPKETLVP